MTLNVVFMGTPDFSVPTLRAILAAGHCVKAVYTQPPRPAGRRGLADTPSPVHGLALENGLSVLTPTSLKLPEEQARFASLDADVAVVIAYGMLLPKPVLDAPRLGCINLHASLLPRWRGAAPIHRAIMAGDAETGVMSMQMEEGLDTGPMLLTARTAIDPDETTGELHDRLAGLGASVVVETLARLEAGNITAMPQPSAGVTYARKIDKAEARIDFSASAAVVKNQIRGLSPFPGAWFEYVHDGKAERIKVLRAEVVAGQGTPGQVLDDRLTIACGGDAIRPLLLQRAGKSIVSLEQFCRGFTIPAGAVIGG
ncbi:MAG: methionyl-tRNA formyltransferase [Hyphomicrobiaceae bacterium]|nr:methionyl-tRNA formyltransferase [Hyphomicrobiaceae bacterium]